MSFFEVEFGVLSKVSFLGQRSPMKWKLKIERMLLAMKSVWGRAVLCFAAVSRCGWKFADPEVQRFRSVSGSRNIEHVVV